MTSNDKVWQVQMMVDGKRVHGGHFENLIHAAQAYDRLALQHHGEFAKLNFPAGDD